MPISISETLLSASGIFSPSLTPEVALSGRPPPPPPTMAERLFRMLPACAPFLTALSPVQAMKLHFPSHSVEMTATASGSFLILSHTPLTAATDRPCVEPTVSLNLPTVRLRRESRLSRAAASLRSGCLSRRVEPSALSEARRRVCQYRTRFRLSARRLSRISERPSHAAA